MHMYVILCYIIETIILRLDNYQHHQSLILSLVIIIFTQKIYSYLRYIITLEKQLIISHKHNMTLECIMLTMCIHVYVAILRESSPHDVETSV